MHLFPKQCRITDTLKCVYIIYVLHTWTSLSLPSYSWYAILCGHNCLMVKLFSYLSNEKLKISQKALCGEMSLKAPFDKHENSFLTQDQIQNYFHQGGGNF